MLPAGAPSVYPSVVNAHQAFKRLSLLLFTPVFLLSFKDVNIPPRGKRFGFLVGLGLQAHVKQAQLFTPIAIDRIPERLQMARTQHQAAVLNYQGAWT